MGKTSISTSSNNSGSSTTSHLFKNTTCNKKGLHPRAHAPTYPPPKKKKPWRELQSVGQGECALSFAAWAHQEQTPRESHLVRKELRQHQKKVRNTFHLRSTSDHVFHVISMAWTIDVCVMPFLRLIFHVGGSNCDTTRLLLCIHR